MENADTLPDSARPTEVILYGTGGHAAVLSDIIDELGTLKVIGIVDDARQAQGKRLLGRRVIGGNSVLQSIRFGSMPVVVGIGDNNDRARVVLSLGARDFPILVHPTAIIGTDVQLGAGSVIMPGAIIEHGAQVGAHCIVHNRAVIGHGSVVGNFSHVSVNAALAGDVRLGERGMVGIGACVIQGVSIGSGAIVGAGSTATRSIPDGYCFMPPSGRLIRGYMNKEQSGA